MTGSSRSSGTLVLERVLRGVALVALVAALLRSIFPPDGASRGFTSLIIDAAKADSAALVARVVGNAIASQAGADASVNAWPKLTVELKAIPAETTRAMLGASAAAGMPVRWTDSTNTRALAIDARRSASPQASTFIDAVGAFGPAIASPNAAMDSSALVVRDQGGIIDSVALHGDVLRVRAARVRGDLRTTMMRDGKLTASAHVPGPDSIRVGRVLLFAQPGWETKFVTAALEESGWVVDGTLALAPRARVRTGTPGSADTSRYSAVVVLDSGTANARDLRRFVAQGGGVVIAGDAVRDPSLASLVSIRVAGHRPALPGGLLTDQPRRGLTVTHLSAPASSVTIERDGGQPVVVVARQGVGRVLVSGYQATWHWRMEGRDESAEDHRRWWDGLVSAVAYSTVVVDSANHAHRSKWPGDAAPVADLVARLGPASTSANAASASRADLLPSAWLLYIIAMTALLAEWALRRLRGAP